MKLVIFILVTFLVSSCTFVPRVTHDPDNPRCRLVTKKRSLRLIVPRVSTVCQDQYCFALAVVYTAATGVVSGSIVLVGNVVHWLEKVGKCDDSFLNQQIFNHNKPLLDQDGELVSEDEEIVAPL